MADPLRGHIERHAGCRLTGFSLAATTRWCLAMGTGALYGFTFSLVIYLAKGGPKSGDTPYMIPSGIVTGGLSVCGARCWLEGPSKHGDGTLRLYFVTSGRWWIPSDPEQHGRHRPFFLRGQVDCWFPRSTAWPRAFPQSLTRTR